MRTLHTKIVGTSFDGRQNVLAMMHGTEAIRIQPEPENEYDHNALAVYVAFPPESGVGIMQVGYIPRELAKSIAPALDGEAMMVSIAEVIGGFETSDGQSANYGLKITVQLPDEEDLVV